MMAKTFKFPREQEIVAGTSGNINPIRRSQNNTYNNFTQLLRG
jgi:hypothetical protein